MTTGRERTRYVARPTRGDERRVRLLESLRELLQTRSLERISIAEISRAAGVTRSAFYFYFPTKQAAVAALLSEFRDEILRAGAAWYDGPDVGPQRRVQDTVEASFGLWRAQASLVIAMLDATGQDPDVRNAWQSWIQDLVDQIAARITQDREAGLIRPTSDPRALAIVLMGATLHTMEQDVRTIAAGESPTDDLAGALIELWFRTLYI